MELLDRQRFLFEQLDKLTSGQGQLVPPDDTGPLLAVLGDRQRLIGQITEVSADLAPYRQSWRQICDGLDDPARNRINELVEQVESLLSVILEQAEQDQRHLEEAKAQLADQLGKVSVAGAALQAYRQVHDSVTSRFTDRQG